MARKDVDLVIRAKDEAAKIVDHITGALNDLIGAQDSLTKSSGKTDSALGNLGTALKALDKELSGGTTASRLTAEMDKATAAADRLQKEFVDTKKLASELAKDLKDAETATTRLAAEAEKAAAASKKQTAALKSAKEAQSALSAELTKATNDRKKLVTAEKNLTTKISEQEDRVVKATARFKELSAQIAATTSPSKTLQNSLERSNTAMDKQQQKLAGLKAEYTATQTGIIKTGEAMASLGTKLEAANKAVEKQDQKVAESVESLRLASGAAKTAAKTQNDLAAAVEKTGDTLTRQTQRIDRAAAELTKLGIASQKADAVLANARSAGKSGLEQQLVQQGLAAQKAKAEFVRLSEAAAKLRAEIGQVGVPTREMSKALGLASQSADEAHLKFLLADETLTKMGLAFRDTSGDINSLVATQAKFISEQNRLGGALNEATNDGLRQRNAVRQLHQAANEAAGGVRKLSDAQRRSADTAGAATGKTNRLADAYRRMYGESRQALSWTQRLRGEVLALVAAYGGIYGVISLLRQTVDAYGTLQAASARLNVTFNGDIKQVGNELDFIRRNADRLGIEFGALANEYSKFAIATQGTALEGEKTRKIFISVAEAARVNNSSFDELRGVFTALTQIVSKGAVQMEELRQQLGDRLPGALQLMADGLGVTSAELIKMAANGEITSEALVPFAEELDKRFGPGLAKALKNTTTVLGQFKNAAFQALLQFGEAGFIESFTSLLKDLTETIKSADFQQFAGGVSKAFGLLAETLGLAVKNFRLLVIAGTAFAGIKLAPLIVALASSVGGLGGRLSRVNTIMKATAGVAASTGTAVGITTTAFRGLTLALRALLSSTGIGLAITAISVAIGYWATSANTATESLVRHREIVDKVKNAYDAAGGAADKFNEALKDITVSQAIANLEGMRAALQDVRNEAGAWLDATRLLATYSADTAAQDQYRELERLSDAFKAGAISAADFKAEVDKVTLAAENDAIKNYGVQLQETADKAADLEAKMGEAEKIVTILSGSTEDAAKAAKELAGTTEDQGRATAIASAKAEEYRKALEDIRDVLPQISDGLDDVKAKAQLDEAFESASRAAQTMGELKGAVDAYNTSLNSLYEDQANKDFGKFTSGIEASAALLRKKEGFQATGKYDVNAYRAGFGSDTTTLADGTIKKITQGMRVSVEEANRDLYRRIGEFQNTIKSQIGGDRFAQFNAQQQAALTSVAYNYGSLPDRIIGAVKKGTDQQIAAAIRGLGGDNKGINRGRRNQEAALFTATGGVETQTQQYIDGQKKAADEAQRAAEERAKQAESTKETLTSQQQEISQQQLINEGKAREAEIDKAIIAAKKANPGITDEELAKIREQTGLLYDLKNVRTEDKNVQKEAVAASAQVNALLSQRTALEQQLKLAQQSGDQTKVQETTTALTEVNTQLDAAISKARAMWEAIGGSAADVAITKLDTAAIKAGTLKVKAEENIFSWQKVGDLFANGLTSAFDQFAQAVANGEDVGEAARNAFLKFASDFLRQIAQMIIKQAIFNALKSFGIGGGLGVGAGHTGGLIGSRTVGGGNALRQVNPMVFAGASRYHEGGLPGLRPGEVPIIAKKGEEVLSKGDPRNALNGGNSPGAAPAMKQDLKIINAIDPASFIDAGLNSSVGEKAFLNFIQANSGAVKAAIG